MKRLVTLALVAFALAFAAPLHSAIAADDNAGAAMDNAMKNDNADAGKTEKKSAHKSKKHHARHKHAHKMHKDTNENMENK